MTACVPARAGLASRPYDFEDLEALAAGDRGTQPPEGITSAAVVGLILRGARRIRKTVLDHKTGELRDQALPASAVQLLCLLAETVYDPQIWKRCDIDLRAWPGNRRLAAYLDTDERTVRTNLRLLEEHHWLIRRYNKGNKRRDLAGIDLRPLARRLHELLDVVTRLEDDLAESIAQQRTQRDDLAAIRTHGVMISEAERKKESSVVDENIRLKSYKFRIPLSSRGVQSGASQVIGGSGTSGARPNAPGSAKGLMPDSELLSLMLAASPTLVKLLTPAEQMEAAEGDARSVVRAVSWMVKCTVKLRPGAWEAGLKNHGFAALAAAVVAAERAERNPGGYLHNMLACGNLRQTIVHSLRQLANAPFAFGRA